MTASHCLRSAVLTGAALLSLSATASAAMLLEYTFDSGTGVNTGVTGANNLSISGSGAAPTFTGPSQPYTTGNSMDNSALTYNTAGQVAGAGTSFGAFSLTNAITITGWINNVVTAGSAAKILDKGATSAGGLTLQFSGSNLNFQFGTGASVLSGTSSGYNYATSGSWIWFGMTYDGISGNLNFYNLDGSNQVTLLNTVNVGTGSYTNNANLMRLMNTSAGNRALDGYMDDFRLFNDVESISQMQALATVPEPASGVLVVAAGLLFGVQGVRRLRRMG